MNTTIWNIDPVHSDIQFKVKHLVISTVTGNFAHFSGKVESNGSFDHGNVAFEADVNSIQTNNEQRDGHLRSPDFFDAEKYPKLSFVSSKFEKAQKDDVYTLEGELTLKGVTRKVTFNVEHVGMGKDMEGKERAGFELSGKINRKDFGLKFDAVTETGSAIVGDEVKLLANVQLVKAA